MNMKFQLLIKTKMLKNKDFFLLSNSQMLVLIILINVKMPTIVGILTFMSMIKTNHTQIELSMKSFITSRPYDD